MYIKGKQRSSWQYNLDIWEKSLMFWPLLCHSCVMLGKLTPQYTSFSLLSIEGIDPEDFSVCFRTNLVFPSLFYSWLTNSSYIFWSIDEDYDRFVTAELEMNSYSYYLLESCFCSGKCIYMPHHLIHRGRKENDLYSYFLGF